MKTREDAVPALSSFNATHFCGMQNRRTFPPRSEHQVMPTAITGIEMLCRKRTEPTHSPTAVLRMCATHRQAHQLRSGSAEAH